MLGQKVDITTPVVSMVHRNRLEEEFPNPYVAIQVHYTTGLVGMNLLVIKQTDAAIIADLMLGGDGLNPNANLGEIQLSAVQEAMNQMMVLAATSMSTIFNKKVDISPPSIDLLNFSANEGTNSIPNEDLLIKVSFRLKIGNLIDSNIMQLLPLEFSQDIVKSLLGEPSPAPIMEQPQPVQQPTAQPQQRQEQPYQQSYAQPTPRNRFIKSLYINNKLKRLFMTVARILLTTSLCTTAASSECTTSSVCFIPRAEYDASGKGRNLRIACFDIPLSSNCRNYGRT
ncbi:hypothetical protein UACE39S_04677 [Ureibacillus acetophenoni]